MSTAPIVAATLGDPCGIGPEVLAKALAGGEVPGRTLVVGDARSLEAAVALVGAQLSVRAVRDLSEARFEPGVIDVLDPGTLDPEDVVPGQITAGCGRAVIHWWDIATRLALDGKVGAAVKGTVSKEAIALGGATQAEPEPPTWLFLITGEPLRVVHLTDHLPLAEALQQVTESNVYELLKLTHDSMVRWGVAAPRIAVAGVNPHAQGREETEAIAPAVRRACEDGVRAEGPVSPDSVFRQCLEGRYDCVVAHYHDQGHIAIKTWKFDGNCALNLGSPFIRLSVPHGPAYDIAGRGIADHRSMTEALRTAAALVAGRGFPGTRSFA
jgi:4-hydroxythreonine-4-phosphate dehydrogenase